jgi:hypothetical protein
MSGTFPERTQPADIDPLDFQLDRLGVAPPRRQVPWQTRLAIGWSTGSLPAVLLLLVGAALGPQGLGLLTPGVLALVDPAIPVALAALGVVVGLGIPARRPGDGRLFAAASVEAVLTGALVAGGILTIAPRLAGSASLQTWLLAAAAGVCAATSSTLTSGDLTVRASALRVRDLDARLPIIAGAALLAVVHGTSIQAGVALAAQASVVALVIAVAGWLLLTSTSSETEQRVFSVAALLLIGGVADYLSLSGLLSGIIAGAFWYAVGGATREGVRRDIGYVQHPLVVVLLLVAGAEVRPSADAFAIAGAYVILRTAGKLAGAWVGRRVSGARLPANAGLYLIAPGVYGVAFAMNAARAVGTDLSVLLTVVVVGTVGSQLVSAVGAPKEDAT